MSLRALESRLNAWEAEGLLREPFSVPGPGEVDLGSNDYLGVGRTAGTTALGSRVLSGEHPHHIELERALASWVGLETSLTMTSGYAANVGTLQAIAQAGDLVVSDALNHASLVDGCRLSRAEIRIVPHLALDDVQAALAMRPVTRHAVVLTESYFSMDADSPDLRALEALCRTYDAALLVDEAHALGVFGPAGAGLCAEAGVTPDVLVGTFGKAIGASGAFVAGSNVLRRWMWNRARPFVFSTGISPALARVVRDHVAVVRAADDKRATLHARSDQFRTGLARLGLSPLGRGPIVPWVVGATGDALRLAERIRAQGVRVHAVRPPTVPANECRIRFALHANVTAAEVEFALAAVRQAL